MSANFQDILQNATLGEIERPKPLPEGSYIALISGVEYGETRGEKKTPYVRVALKVMQPLDDVDEEDLANFGDVQGKATKQDFFVTDNAIFMLQDFILEHVGLEMAGQTLDQAIPQIVNNQVGIKIGHRIDQRNPENVFAEVKSTFNPEDAE